MTLFFSLHDLLHDILVLVDLDEAHLLGLVEADCPGLHTDRLFQVPRPRVIDPNGVFFAPLDGVGLGELRALFD